MPHLVSSPAGEQHDATDSIYSGPMMMLRTTAVILLADYFKKMNNNERHFTAAAGIGRFNIFQETIRSCASNGDV
jgi:hypothetical protein